MIPLPSLQQNHILAAMNEEESERLSPHLELVKMPLGDMLYQPNEQLRHAYFPTSAIISLHYVTESGASAEVSGVGNEGVVGIPLFMGGDSTSSSAVIQTAGHAFRLEREIFKAEFSRGGAMQLRLLSYAQALITQISQTAACNRHHNIEQQFCRWLLLNMDRIPSGDFLMTQELVANTLGVRRESVTEAAGKLQRDGYISYRRGHISVLDRIGLEQTSCECYSVVRKELLRLEKTTS